MIPKLNEVSSPLCNDFALVFHAVISSAKVGPSAKVWFRALAHSSVVRHGRIHKLEGCFCHFYAIHNDRHRVLTWVMLAS